MGKIYYIMGKSSSGKDTLYKELGERFPMLRTVVPYTTRPIRHGEKNGKEYFFVTESEMESLRKGNRILELRSYDTVHGLWYYFTADDGQIKLTESDYLMIGTLESYEKIRDYYGEDQVIPLYIEVESGERLMRALLREKNQERPKYKEMCRRFLADEEDFSEENLERLKIVRRFKNDSKEDCLEEMAGVIRNGKL